MAVKKQEKESYPKLFKFEEGKHHSHYIVHSNKGELEMFFTVLATNFDFELYDHLQFAITYGKKPKFSKKEVEALPDSMSTEKELMLQQITDYGKKEKETAYAMEMFKNIVKTVENGNKKKAAEIMNDLRKAGYEKWYEVRIDQNFQ